MTEYQMQLDREAKMKEYYELTTALQSQHSKIGDYVIVKCYEAALIGEEPDYSTDELKEIIAERKAARKRINEIRAEMNIPGNR